MKKNLKICSAFLLTLALASCNNGAISSSASSNAPSASNSSQASAPSSSIDASSESSAQSSESSVPVTKTDVAGVNTLLKTLVDEDGHNPFPELDFSRFADEFYVQDKTAAQSSEACLFLVDFYVPADNLSSEDCLLFGAWIFSQLLEYSSCWSQLEFYRYCYDDGKDPHYFTTDSYLQITHEGFDLNGDGADENVVAWEASFFRYAG